MFGYWHEQMKQKAQYKRPPSSFELLGQTQGSPLLIKLFFKRHSDSSQYSPQM